MEWKLIMKQFFMFFYSISNIATTFFCIPILIQFISDTNNNISWIIIALFFLLYELGRLIGYIIWKKLDKRITSIVIILITLIILIILHLWFGFIHSITLMLLHRLLVGFINCLPLCSKKTFAELSIKTDTFNFFFITSLASFLSVFIPLMNNSVLYIIPESISIGTIPMNQFTPSCICLIMIYIITIALGVTMIQLGILKTTRNGTFMEMNNNDNNDLTNEIEKKKENEPNNLISKKDPQEMIEVPDDKNSQRLELSKAIKRDSISPVKIIINGNLAMDHSSNKNHSTFKVSIGNSSTRVIKQKASLSHEFKYSLIYGTIQLSDCFLSTIYIIVYYICFQKRIFMIIMNMTIVNMLSAIMNFSLSEFIQKKIANQKEVMVRYMNYMIIICLIVNCLIGLCLPYYFLGYPNLIIETLGRTILFCLCIMFLILRNIFNGILMQIYQLYFRLVLNGEVKRINKVEYFHSLLSTVGKMGISFIAAFSYKLFNDIEGKSIIDKVIIIIFTLMIPEILHSFLFFMIKVYIPDV